MVVTCCAWCERYALADEWISVSELVTPAAPSEARVSHGICPECLEELPSQRPGT